MSLYESVVVLRSDLSSNQVEDAAKNLEKILSDNNAKVEKIENIGLRSLAYPIKKNKKAYYLIYDIEAEGPAVIEFERRMRLEEDIIRYMTVKVKEFKKDVTPLFDTKASKLIKGNAEKPKGKENKGGK